MLIKSKSTMNLSSLKWLWSKAMGPISPKDLRMTATMIAVYHMLLAHVILFVVLLGLAHAEQMKTMLALDIEDQKSFGLYELTPFTNQVRLKSASKRAMATDEILYIATAIASIYLISCISMVIGIYRNRAEFILPWLITALLFLFGGTWLMFKCQNYAYVQVIGGKIVYFTVGIVFILADLVVWFIMHSFYQSLREMRKLTEIATVAIPCPPPGMIPYQYRRENMYLGSNGYKHILSDNPDENRDAEIKIKV